MMIKKKSLRLGKALGFIGYLILIPSLLFFVLTVWAMFAGEGGAGLAMMVISGAWIIIIPSFMGIIVGLIFTLKKKVMSCIKCGVTMNYS